MSNATVTADQLKAMAGEMSNINDMHDEAGEPSNPVIQFAFQALRSARKAAQALETGRSLGGYEGAARREIAQAVEIYEAAKVFGTPEPQTGTPVVNWDKNAKIFTIRYF